MTTLTEAAAKAILQERYRDMVLRCQDELLATALPHMDSFVPRYDGTWRSIATQNQVQRALADNVLTPGEAAIIKQAHLIVSCASDETGPRLAVVHARIAANDMGIITVKNQAAMIGQACHMPTIPILACALHLPREISVKPGAIDLSRNTGEHDPGQQQAQAQVLVAKFDPSAEYRDIAHLL